MLLGRRQPSGGAGGRHLRGQTMVEIIILIAALSVLALVLVGILGFLPKNALGTQIEQSKTYWSSQAAPIKINDWSMLTVNRTLPTLAVYSNLSLVLSNPTTEVITVHAVRITPGNFSQIYLSDGTWAGPADDVFITLHPGEQKTVIVQHWASGPEAFIPPDIYQLTLSFEYTMAFTSSIEAGVVPVVGGNRYLVGDPGTDCPPPLVSCGQICAPANLCCGSGACTPGKFCCGNSVCCQAGSELCQNGTCVPATGCTPPNFECGSACCDPTEMCNESTSACQACPPSAPLACGTTCCAEGEYCDRSTSTCLPSCDPPDFTCPSGEFYCCNGTQFHFCDPVTGACPESCIAPDTTCGPDENGTSYCCNQTQECNVTTNRCQDISCSGPGQILCNSTDGSRSTCCSDGLECANLTGTCCDTSTPTLPPTILCDYTNLTGSFSACCDGLNCSTTIGCCVGVGNPCNESMGMFCCDGSSCPASGICECNEEAPCCMNQEGGWCNSTDPNIELSCCAASGLLCDLASNSCYLNSSTPCIGEGTPYRALNNSWSCCYPDNRTFGTGYFDPPFPEERQVCCQSGSSICGSGADSVCCPSGSCSTDGVCCSANTTNQACGTGYLYTECCAAGLNCTQGTPYDACCNPATTLDVCNDPANGMTCCGEICKDGPVSGLASYESVCCNAPDNAAVCDGPECCSAPCITKGLAKVCCPGAGGLPPTQFVCADNSCCDQNCNDMAGAPRTVDAACCANLADEVCSDGSCCDSTLGKSCVDENGLQTGTTLCCDAGTVSCNGACCAAGDSCSAEGAAKACCAAGTDLWGGACCAAASQKTGPIGEHVCCDETTHHWDAATGSCCWINQIIRDANGGTGDIWFDNAVSPHVPPACPSTMCCPADTQEICDASNTNSTSVCCPNLCQAPQGVTGCPPNRFCCASPQIYCNSDPAQCCDNCLTGPDGQQYCCPAGTEEVCPDATTGIIGCCAPPEKTPVKQDNILSSASICCPALGIDGPNSMFCTGDNGGLGACCGHACTIDLNDPDRKGYCCTAGAVDFCSLNGTTNGCCANACSDLTVGSTTSSACCPGGDPLTCGATTVTTCDSGSMTCCVSPTKTVVSTFDTPLQVTRVAPNECCNAGDTRIAVNAFGGYKCCGADGNVTVSNSPSIYLSIPSYDCCAPGAGGTGLSCNMQCCNADTQKCTYNDAQCCDAQNVANKTDGTNWMCCVAGQTPMNSADGSCCTDSGNFVCSTPDNSIQTCCPDSYNGYPVGCNTGTAECVYYSAPPPSGCPAGFACEGGTCAYHCPNGQTYYDGSC